MTTHDSNSHNQEPKIDLYILRNTITTDVEYTHENDKKSGSNECPNIVSIISQPAPVLHCILHALSNFMDLLLK